MKTFGNTYQNVLMLNDNHLASFAAISLASLLISIIILTSF